MVVDDVMGSPVAAQAKGAQIKYTAWYDNSAKNPANPDPTKTIYWGEQTFEEMQLGYFEYIVPGLKLGEEPMTQDEIDRKNYKNVFDQFDKNGDGVITKDEFPQPALFDQIDENKDGKVTLDEAIKFFKKAR